MNYKRQVHDYDLDSLFSLSAKAMLRGNLRKAFHGFDLLMLGTGIVIGSGVFSLTGAGMALYAGSAIVLSYAIACLACLCAAACYAELCVEYPVSGSAFTYVIVTFGEYPAYVTMAMLIMEYFLGMAAVARGFSQYLAQLVDQSWTLFVFDDKGLNVDVMAFGIVWIVSIALSFGVKESSRVLNIATLVKFTLIIFIIIAGFVKADPQCFDPYFPPPERGVDGIFQGIAAVFFAFVAFDAVCNAVEETPRPTRIPGAIIGTVGVSGVIYVLMAASLALIIDPTTLLLCSNDRGDFPDPQPKVCPAPSLTAPPPPDPRSCIYPNTTAYRMAYTVAFNGVDLPWMQFIVALAALTGIITSLQVGLFSVARLVMVAARSWLLPAPLARISPRTQTPIIAQMTIAVIVSVIALLVRYGPLSGLVTLGALFAMLMVSNVVLFRRYYPQVKLRYTAHGTVEAEYSKALSQWRPGARLSRPAQRVVVWVHIILINALSLGLVLFDRLTLEACQATDTICQQSSATTGDGVQRNRWVAAWLVAWAAVTVSMFIVCPMEYEPKDWAIKWWLLPFLPSFSILLIFFSAGYVDVTMLWVFLIYFIFVSIFYVFFSMPMSYIRHFTVGPSNSEQLNVVELVEVDGKYVPFDIHQTQSSMATRQSTTLSFLSSTKGNTSDGVDEKNGSGSSDGSLPSLSLSLPMRITRKTSRSSGQTSATPTSLPALEECIEDEEIAVPKK